MPPEIPHAQPTPSVRPPVPPRPIAMKKQKRMNIRELDFEILVAALIIFFLLLFLGNMLMSDTSNEFLYWFIGLIMIITAVLVLVAGVVMFGFNRPVERPVVKGIPTSYLPPPPGFKKESPRMDLVGIGIGLLAMSVILISFGGYLYSFLDLYEPGSTPDNIMLHRPFGLWAILLIVFGFIILFLGLATFASIYPEEEERYSVRSYLTPEQEMMKGNKKMLYESIATLVIGTVYLAIAFYIIGDTSVSGYSSLDPYLLVSLILLVVGIIIVVVGIIYLIWSIYRLWKQTKWNAERAQQ